MYDFKDKYINPFTDFGFKRLFGEEPNKELLLDFLNELLKEEQGQITKLTYLKNERLGLSETERKAIFDLYCENERGEKFIVEIQKSKQNYFKDRTVYYSSFPINEQGKRNDWNFELKSVYMIAILDFEFDEDKNQPDKYRYDIKLSDIDTKKVFYDKLTFIYLSMPKFNKSIDELETRFDKWLYVLKNLSRLDNIPDRFRERIFERLFEVAEISKFNLEQLRTYEDSLKYYRDMNNVIDTARDEGKIEGILEGESKGIIKGKIEIARKMLDLGYTIEQIIEITGIDRADIE